MLDLSKEFKEPAEDAGWIVKVLIGSALVLAYFIQWFLFPLAFFSIGYIYRNFMNHFRLQGAEKLPEWTEWKDLFLKGLVISLIALGYYILPWFSYQLSSDVLEGGVLAKMVGLVFMAATALLYVIALFFLPMGIAQYARNEQFSSAFSIREIWDRIMNIGDNYFKITLLSIVAIVLVTILRLLPLAGALLTALLGFYTSLVFGSLFGQICREAYPEENTEAVETEAIETGNSGS